MKHFYRFLVAAGFMLAGCEPDEQPVLREETPYFSFEAGAYQTYNITETIYTEIKDTETRSYQLRMQLVDSFPNADEGFTYVLSRMKRNSPADVWEDLDTWSVRFNEGELIINEGNISFVKLLVPPRVDLTWNGNKFNNEVDDEYVITSVDEPLTVNGIVFDNTVTVTQENNEDFIVFLDERREVYAENVGLILKEVTQFEYCTQDQCLGQQVIKNGREFKQELIEYGNQ